jgi:hypothetical protein
MRATLRKFEMGELQVALDDARRTQGLTWVVLRAEINKAFEGTPSIPINLSTIRGMRNKRSVTSAVVLQGFSAGNTAPPQASEILPEPGAGRVLRFDTRAMHAALDAQRLQRSMTWKQVAGELPGFTESTLTNLATGPLIGFPRVMMITQWRGRPAASFVRVHSR